MRKFFLNCPSWPHKGNFHSISFDCIIPQSISIRYTTEKSDTRLYHLLASVPLQVYIDPRWGHRLLLALRALLGLSRPQVVPIGSCISSGFPSMVGVSVTSYPIVRGLPSVYHTMQVGLEGFHTISTATASVASEGL